MHFARAFALACGTITPLKPLLPAAARPARAHKKATTKKQKKASVLVLSDCAIATGNEELPPASIVFTHGNTAMILQRFKGAHVDTIIVDSWEQWGTMQKTKKQKERPVIVNNFDDIIMLGNENRSGRVRRTCTATRLASAQVNPNPMSRATCAVPPCSYMLPA